MKVLLVTGSYPPMACGVGDYTYLLKDHLGRQQEVFVEVIFYEDWSYRNFPSILKMIKRIDPDIIEIQYPTIHYRAFLTPQLIAILCSPTVVMLHEISTAHPLRKLALLPFFLFANRIVFSNDHERDYALKMAPWIKKRSLVIPIGCNIPVLPKVRKSSLKEVIYFGLLRPNKGIEDVIELARIFDEKKLDFTVKIIGKQHPNWPGYVQKLKSMADGLKISWAIDVPDDEVFLLLQRAVYGYVPFPDGASERRGSLLALLANGVVTITTKGRATTRALEEVVRFASSPSEALDHLLFLNNNPHIRKSISESGRRYIARFSWPEIANRHTALFMSLTKAKRLL